MSHPGVRLMRAHGGALAALRRATSSRVSTNIGYTCARRSAWSDGATLWGWRLRPEEPAARMVGPVRSH
jgi:hypothetical protein